VDVVNINHLKAFIKVIDTKSYQEAARILAVSQPAITLRIQALEEHFQTKLIKRSSEGISLTNKGDYVYREIVSIVGKWDQLEAYFKSDQPSGRLALGASTIPSEYLLPDLLKRFREEFTEVHFSMSVAGTKEVYKWLLNRSVDMIVTGKPEDNGGMESVPLYNDNLKVIIPLNSDQPISSFSDLLSYDWIVRDKYSDTRKAFQEALNKKGFSFNDLHVSCQMGSTEAVIAAVEAGLGISIISKLAADRAEKHKRIKAIDLEDFQINRSFYLSYLKENKHEPTITAFLSFLKEYRFLL
jgi:DNA-binding transcriptional LysR family regulator